MVSAVRDKKAAQRTALLDPPSDGELDDKKPRHDRRTQLLSPATAATAATVLLLYLITMSLLRRFAIDLSLDVGAMKLFAARLWEPMPNTTAVVEAPPPMAAPKNWTVDEIIDHVAGPKRSLIVVPVTSNYLDFTENFFLSASKVGLGQRVLFVTVDDESWELLHGARPDQTVKVQSLGAPEPLKGNKSEAVYNSAFFHSVVDRKPVYIRALLEKNVSVLFSDADIVLFGDPHKWFTGDYDVWVTKDTNAFDETRKLYPKDLPMPLKREAITDRVQHMCSCFIYARPTSGGKLIMDRWIKAIKDHTKATGNGTADQPMLNKALVETPQAQARVAVLPIPRFPSGCLFFGTRGLPCSVEHRQYQRQVGLGKVSPIWAHNNFIRGHDVKLRRFVDHDLWFVDEPAAVSHSASTASARTSTASASAKGKQAKVLIKTKTSAKNPLIRRSKRSRHHKSK